LSGGFLNSFYKWIYKRADLTVFEALSLPIAIPSTFVIKFVTVSIRPTFENIDMKFLESIVAATKEEIATGSIKPGSKKTMKNVVTVILGYGCGAALISVFHKNVKVA
jgi:hypothetical protein